MNNYTKGEWIAHDGQIYPMDDERHATIAIIPYFDKENKEQQANALLIAAAPELLQACKNTLNILCSTGYEINKDKTELNLNFFADSMDIISHLKNIVNKVEGEE